MSRAGIYEGSDNKVIHQLNELFGSVLNLDVIKTVAESCKYDVLESSNKLLEISNTSEKRKYVEEEQKCVWKVNPRSEPSSTHLSTAASCMAFPKKSKKTLDFETAVQQINKGYKVLILMRGLPGSGKSSLALKILQHTIGLDNNFRLHILSTDDYFCQNSQNSYKYEIGKIEEAHGWNQRRAFEAMSRGFSPVIIDNTNTQMWEMKAYATMAIDYGYFLHIIEPDTHWCFNDKELTKRNVHGVPRTKIKDMLDRYEKNIRPQKLLCAYNLSYKFQKPPQLRLYPPPDINVSKDNKIGNFVKSTSMSVLSTKTSNNIQHNETINLMDFDDDEDNDSRSTKSTKSQPIDKNFNGGILNSWSQNAVDKILMFNDSTASNNVLKPTPTIEKDMFEISSDEEDKNNFYSRIEQDWGIKESSIKSWDIVTPINDPPYQKVKNNSVDTKKNKQIETVDNSSNTESEYFRLINNDKVSPGFYGGLKIIETVNRDINYSTPKREPNILLKLTLDKSCMTDDIYDDFETHISELQSLFPTVPISHLTYWYNKCKGDLEWTIEFLLEAQDETVSLIVTDDDSDNEKPESNNSNSNHLCDSRKIAKISKKKLKKSENASPDDKDEIKKIIESKIDIGGEHYSKHLLRVKNYKSKIDNNDRGTANANINEPSTSKSVHPAVNMDEIISIDSDFEFDDVEIENSFEMLPEETVELNLGEYFVSQLEKKFADPNIQYPKGFQPVVQMPVTLAKQLYSFYIESVYQQMENQENVLEGLVKEDEEFAKKLQAKEDRVEEERPNEPSSLKEIQEDQLAAKKAHQREVDKWKYLNPDTLAAKLTKQKLFAIFPSIPQDDLLEVLNAHDNKYVDTLETLLASTKTEIKQDFVDIIREPPIEDTVLEEMKEAQQTSTSKESQEPQEATYYREEANKYLKKRADLYQKAQQYHTRGMTEVAQFYTGLASLQTTYFDRANNMAATAFLDEHSKRLQDFNTIDLHFLYVKEAVPALDVFLDRNINLLRHSSIKQTEYLQIITGRGNRSRNGKSVIKPVIMSRLNQRKIKFVVLNPGLLKVKITKNSLVTSEFLTS